MHPEVPLDAAAPDDQAPGGDSGGNSVVQSKPDVEAVRSTTGSSSPGVSHNRFQEALGQQLASLQSWLATAFAAKLEEVRADLIAKHCSAVSDGRSGRCEGTPQCGCTAPEPEPPQPNLLQSLPPPMGLPAMLPDCTDSRQASNERPVTMPDYRSCSPKNSRTDTPLSPRNSGGERGFSATNSDETDESRSEQSATLSEKLSHRNMQICFEREGQPIVIAVPGPPSMSGSMGSMSEAADQLGPLPRPEEIRHSNMSQASRGGRPASAKGVEIGGHGLDNHLSPTSICSSPSNVSQMSLDSMISIMSPQESAARREWRGGSRSYNLSSRYGSRRESTMSRGSAYCGSEQGTLTNLGQDSRRSSEQSHYGAGIRGSSVSVCSSWGGHRGYWRSEASNPTGLPLQLNQGPGHLRETCGSNGSSVASNASFSGFQVDQGWEEMAKGSNLASTNTEDMKTRNSDLRTSMYSKLSVHEPQWSGLQKATERQQTLGAGAKVMRDSEFTFIRKFMISPFAKKRATWDVLGMVLICYDIIVLPLQVFPLPNNAWFDFAKWFALLFWTFDIVGTFLTGVFNPKGNYIEMRPCSVARKYIRGWLFFDLFVVAPDWLIVMTDGDSEGSATRLGKSVRALRMLRTLRLLRLAKLRRIVLKLEKRLNNEYMVCYINLAKLMVCIAVLNHVVACGWYGMSELGSGDGWVSRLGFDIHPVHYQYLSSLHWSLSNFQGNMEVYPGSTAERVYAVFVLYIGLIQVSYFISSITNFMTQIKQIHAETMQRRWKLLRYLYDNNITAELSMRVKQFVDKVTLTQRTKDKEVELLNVLSMQLQMDLQTEIKAPALLIHPLLNNLVYDNEALGGQLCSRITQVSMHYGECLYRRDEPCEQMFIVKSGRLRYSKLMTQFQDPRQARVSAHMAVLKKSMMMAPWNKSFSRKGSQSGTTSKQIRPGENYVESGDWMSEMSLWTVWWHQGFCVAITGSDVFGLASADLQELVSSLAVPKKTKVAQYAVSYVKWMNSEDPQYLDDLTRKKTRRTEKVEEEFDETQNRGLASEKFSFMRSATAEGNTVTLHATQAAHRLQVAAVKISRRMSSMIHIPWAASGSAGSPKVAPDNVLPEHSEEEHEVVSPQSSRGT